MAKTDERVMRMVEQALTKNPDASGDELFEKAKKLNGGIGRMSRRQFHARYPLQVKRKRTPAGGRKRKTAAKQGGAAGGRGGRVAAGGAHRDALRQVFMRFAHDVAAASESPKELVKLIQGVDRYVDEAIRSTGR